MSELAELNALLDVARQLGATTELAPLLGRVTEAVVDVLRCERATIFLHDAAADELYAKALTGGEAIRFAARLGIAGESFKTATPINVPDAYADARFNRAIDRTTGYRTRNLLTFPMLGHDGRPVGVLQALNKHDGPFDALDEERATVLGTLAGVAIERQMLLDAFAEKQRLKLDLELARRIQQRQLPTETPEVEGYDLAGWNKPADDTGGDFYDYVRFDDGRLGVILADATGHGIGPALIAAECRALVRALASVSDDPTRIMTQANRLIYEDLDGGRFVTAYFGILDPRRHAIDYLSAGHGPSLHYVAREGACREIGATTVPLGVLDEIDGTPGEPITLAPGDMLVLMTDGFFEWAGAGKEPYGIARLAAVVHASRDLGAAGVIEAMRRSVTAFVGAAPQKDDLTAVVIKRVGYLRGI